MELQLGRRRTIQLMLEKQESHIESLRSRLAKAWDARTHNEMARTEEVVRRLREQLEATPTTPSTNHQEVGPGLSFCSIE